MSYVNTDSLVGGRRDGVAGRQDCPAGLACTQFLTGGDASDYVGDLAFDVDELEEFLMDHRVTLVAVPTQAVAFMGQTLTFDDETDGVRGATRRVGNAGWKQKQFAFSNLEIAFFTILDDRERDIAFKLIKQLLAWVDVVVAATVRAADDHHDGFAVDPHAFVADGWAQEVAVLVDPVTQVDGWRERHIVRE